MSMHRKRLIGGVSALVLLVAAPALANPTGGTVVDGTAAITGEGTATVTVTGGSSVINWTSFSNTLGETVQFNLSTSSISVNRVTGPAPSVIAGVIQGVGNIILINPNGVAITPTGQINLTRFAASTSDISTFCATCGGIAGDNYIQFDIPSPPALNAVITNDGAITVSSGGAATLQAAEVTNSGSITAPGGVVSLVAADRMSTTLLGPPETLAYASVRPHRIVHSGAVTADGGEIHLLTADYPSPASSPSRGEITSTGTFRALGSGICASGACSVVSFQAPVVSLNAGEIDIQSSGDNGGLLRVYAPTSLAIADAVAVRTLSTTPGTAGEVDLTQASFEIGGNLSVARLQGFLAEGRVNLTALTEMRVSAPLTFAAGDLSLRSRRNLFIDSTISATGSSRLFLEDGRASSPPGGGAPHFVEYYGTYFKPTADGRGYLGKVEFGGRTGAGVLNINGAGYTVLDNLTALQAMGDAGGLSTNFALAADVDAAATAGWNGGAGFNPVRGYSGTFYGLGHVISNLTINRPAEDQVGLFGSINWTYPESISRPFRVLGVTLTGASVTGRDYVGGLVGTGLLSGTPQAGNGQNGTDNGRTGAHVSGSGVFGTVTGRTHVGGAGGLSGGLRIVGEVTASSTGTGDVYLGGLFGRGSAELSSATVMVTALPGAFHVGGLVGEGLALSSQASGTVTAGDGAIDVGGLVGRSTKGSGVGQMVSGNFTAADSTSAVAVTAGAGARYVGGVAGRSIYSTSGNTGTASVTVGAGSQHVGGVVGDATGSSHDASSSTVTAPSGAYVGGLIGSGPALYGTRTGTVNASGSQYVGAAAGMGAVQYTTSSGTVVGNLDVGGLSGYGATYASSSSVQVTGGDRVGGASGNGFVELTTTSGTVSGVNRVGGLAGQGGALDSTATGDVTATGGAVGGGVGYQTNSWVTRSSATGAVSGLYNVGGLVGESTGTGAIFESSYTGPSVSGFHQVGGLVGRTASDPSGTWYGRVLNSHYDADSVLINGAHHITVGGLYAAQYADWAADKVLNVGDYFTLSGGDYIIDSAQKFRDLLGFINPAAANTVRPIRFRLAADIDLTAPPAGSDVAFTWLPELWVQAFDGGGHTVRVNINQDPARILANDMMGLVGMAPAGATLSGLTVSGAVHGVNAQGLGGAVGAAQGAVNHLRADGISVSATTDASDAVFNALTVPMYWMGDGSTHPANDQPRYIARFTGGLVGNAIATLSDLSGTGTVTSDGDLVGGLVGKLHRFSPGDNFSFTGAVTGRDQVGGLFGRAYVVAPNNRVYTNFSHAGDVTGRDMVGGLLGRLQVVSSNDLGSYNFDDFTASGTVLGRDRVGGMFGEAGTGIYDFDFAPGSFAGYEAAYANFRRMAFSGDVEGTGDRIGGIAGDFGFGLSLEAPRAILGHVTGQDYVGGVVGDGYATADAVVEGAGGALAPVTGRNYVGGLAGSASFTDRAAVRARVTGQDHVGGLVGGGVNQARDSTVLADVTGRDYVGGAFGQGWQGARLNVLSGSVIAGRDWVGGVAGDGEIDQSRAVATVTGNNRVGGLIGNGWSNRSAAAGTVTGVDRVGGLLGSGNSSQSFALSTVLGNDFVGGLIGDGTADESFAESTVTGRNHVGGLLGAGYATDSYAVGSVSGVDYVGGLLGGGPPGAAPAPVPGLPDPVPSTGSGATGSYADVSVIGVSHTGAFSGGADPFVLVDYYDDPFDVPDLGTLAWSYQTTYGNYWNAARTPGLPGDGQVVGHAGMTGLADLTHMSSYTTLDTSVDPAVPTPWSLTATPNDPAATTWRIYEGLSAPLLRVFMAPLEVTAAPVTKVYDGLPFAGSSAYALGAVAADDWHAAGTATASLVVGKLDSAGVNAGVYSDLSIARANLNGMRSRQAALVGGEIRTGYDLFGAPSTLTITAAGLSILGTAGTKTYDGGAVFDASRLTLSGVLAGDIVNLSGQARTASANVGTYLSWASSSLVVDNPNYTLAGGSVTATITPAPLVLTATSQSKVYGNVVTFTGAEFTAIGLVAGETVGSARLSSAGAPAPAPVGTYPIVISGAAGGTFNPGNYSLSYVNGVLAVTARPVTLLGVSGTRTYDGTPVFPASGLSLSGVLAGDQVRLSGQASTASADVGTYLSWASSSLALDNPNYTLEGGSVLAVITPAPLVIRAHDASKVYGDALAFAGTEFTATGLAAGETVGGVQLSSPGAAARAGVGPYVTGVSGAAGGTFRPSNYAITYVEGVLVVRPRVLGVTGVRIYDGTPRFQAEALSLSGVLSGDQVLLTGAAETAGPHVGDYARWAVSTLALSSPDYTLEGGSILATITPAPLTVTAADAAKPFGFSLAFSGQEFRAAGLVDGETIGRVDLDSPGAPASAAPGAYAIRATGASGGTFRPEDYRIVYVDGRLVVDRPVLPPGFPDDPLEQSSGGGFLTFANGAAMDPARPLSKVEYDPLDDADLLGWIEGYLADTVLPETSESTGILEYKRLAIQMPYQAWRSRRAAGQ